MALEEQMELFDNGTLMQEGGKVDEESGNEVPIGSTKEEVRDDIPAQLSEGEFVMPADAVRYHGLDKMMALRQEAKLGLKRMEEMGMMGNSEEATLPDDIPFTIDDLDMEDDGVQEFNVGGFVQQPFGTNISGGTGVGGYQQSQFANYQPTYTAYQGIQPPAQNPTAGTIPQQASVPVTTPPTQLPSFTSFVTPNYVTYVNPQTGATISVPVDQNGKPLIPVPAGFVPQSTQAATQPTTPPPATTPTTGTQTAPQQGGGGGDSQKTPQEIAQEEERQQLFADRKAAAKELGYTKEIGLGESLLGLTPVGFLSGNPEKGTVLGDGTIADGQGNSFDPITGKQVGYSGGIVGNIAGGLGLRDKVAPEGFAAPESSYAGLRSMAGEQSIADVLAGVGSTPERIKELVPSAKVETTLGQTAVTDAATTATPETVTEAATSAAAAEAAPTKSFDELVEERIAEYTAKSPNVSPEQIRAAAIEDVQFDMAMAQKAEAGTLKSDIQKAFSAPVDEAALRKQAEAKVAEVTTPKTKAQELQAMIAEAASTSNRRQRANLQAKISDEMGAGSGYNKQYEKDIRAGKYDDAFNARDSFERDLVAEIQRSERAEIAKAKSEGRSANLGSRPAGRGEVGDSKGNVVRSSDGTPVTSSGRQSSAKGRALAAEREQREAENSVDSRVICTELYRQGKLNRELYRMDVMYTARHLSPTVVKGYHYWAIPIVRKMRKSDRLTKFMLYFTIKRAEEIAHIVNPAKYPKSSIAGKIIKNVGEALCYGIGLFVNNSDYKALYKGEKTC